MHTYRYTQLPPRDTWRPLLPIVVGSGEFVTKALLDSGAVNTVFDSELAAVADIDLTHADVECLAIGGASVHARFVTARLALPRPAVFDWEARIGFADDWGSRPAILGNEVFRFFTVTFRTADHEFDIEPNSA